MKSKHEFATIEDYREYLLTYFVGQIISRTANSLQAHIVLQMAEVMVHALYPLLENED